MATQDEKTQAQESIKLSLKTEEVALIVSALALLKSELSLADEELPNLKFSDARLRIPTGLFRSLDSAIDRISNVLLRQSQADFEERGDEVGKERFHQVIHERWEQYKELIELMQLVLMSAYAKDG